MFTLLKNKTKISGDSKSFFLINKIIFQNQNRAHDRVKTHEPKCGVHTVVVDVGDGDGGNDHHGVPGMTGSDRDGKGEGDGHKA